VILGAKVATIMLGEGATIKIPLEAKVAHGAKPRIPGMPGEKAKMLGARAKIRMPKAKTTRLIRGAKEAKLRSSPMKQLHHSVQWEQMASVAT
jgi:hypothetical protein